MSWSIASPAYANQDPFLKWLMLRTPFANIAHIVMTLGWLSLSFISRIGEKQLCLLLPPVPEQVSIPSQT